MYTRKLTLSVLTLLLASCGGAATVTPSVAPSSAAASAAASKPAAAASGASAKPSAAAASGASAKPSAAAGAQPAGAPVKVGYIIPISGPVASYGAMIKFAPEIVVKEINASGGINGSPLQVVTLDSPNNPNQAVTDVRRLADEEKVVALVGPYYTGEMQAAAPVINQVKAPALAETTAASYPGFVQAQPWVFLTDTNDELTSGLATDAFKKVYPDVKKMVIVGDAQTAVTALMIKTLWPKILPAKGLQIADTITYDFGTSDFSAIVTRIKGDNPQGIALSSLTPAALNLLTEMQRQGLKLPIVSSSHLQTVPTLPQILGSAADGMIQTMWYSPAEASKPGVKAFLDKYQAAVGDLSFQGKKPRIGYASEIQTYDDFNMLAKALRNAGVKGDTPPDQAREKTRQALMNIKGFPGVLRSKDITPEGRITWESYPLIAKNGDFQPAG